MMCVVLISQSNRDPSIAMRLFVIGRGSAMAIGIIPCLLPVRVSNACALVKLRSVDVLSILSDSSVSLGLFVGCRVVCNGRHCPTGAGIFPICRSVRDDL